MGCQVEIAAKIVEHKADFLLPLKGNQPTLEAEVEAYSSAKPRSRKAMAASRPASLPPRKSSIGSRARNPIRVNHVSKTSVRFFTYSIETEYADRCTFDTRIYISSAPLDIERLAAGSRGHWGVESMHWVLDVEFNDDLSRYRAGHGAKNMAVVRRFALSLLRANKSKGSIKTRRKSASWNTQFLLEILQMK
jgi:predicted transposase YbfD/YdcC